MFTADDIKTRIKQSPFVPVRVVTSSGEAFDVHHPDLIMVGRRALIIGTASAEDATTFEQVARVALMHVTALEDLPTTAPGSGNGQP